MSLPVGEMLELYRSLLKYQGAAVFFYRNLIADFCGFLPLRCATLCVTQLIDLLCCLVERFIGLMGVNVCSDRYGGVSHEDPCDGNINACISQVSTVRVPQAIWN